MSRVGAAETEGEGRPRAANGLTELVIFRLSRAVSQVSVTFWSDAALCQRRRGQRTIAARSPSHAVPPVPHQPPAALGRTQVPLPSGRLLTRAFSL